MPMARHVLYCDVPVNRPTAQLLVARLSRLASECWQALTLVGAAVACGLLQSGDCWGAE